MAKIEVLSRAVADKIAAGEVVERPAAVVKELVENSIDAGATEVEVEIKNGGITYISVRDNGKGIPQDELEIAFLRHATSKLREIDDLFEIATMGFRGEALASICAVAEVSVVSRTADSQSGVCMTVKHGVLSEKEEVACNVGTTMVVENLFANVPARMKFLKKDSTESGYVADIVMRIALSKPGIAFRYICDGKEVFSTSGDGKLKNAILNIYGMDHAKNIYEVDYREHGVRVCGVVGKAELARGNRTRQTLMVNGRYIKNHVVSKVVEEAYRNILMTGKFPFFVLDIELAPQLVDVNVHPAKTEIKFANEKEVYNIVHSGVKNALYRPAESISEMTFKTAERHNVTADLREDAKNPDRRIIKEFMERTVPREGFGSEAEYSFRASEVFAKPYIEKTVDEKEERAEDVRKADEIREKLFKETFPPKSRDEETLAKNCDQFARKAFDDAIIENIDGQPFCEDAAARVVGQLFDTYIIAQKNEEVFLIDQHAAHERRRFEMLKKDYLEKKPSGQQLLAPIVFDVDAVELQAVKENRQMLEDMGFLMEEFGRGSVIIRETPLIGDEGEIKALAVEVISALIDRRPLGMLSFEERILDMVSCKYAIKANKKLSLPEMEGIVKDVEDLERKGICTCPHGRPIKLSFSKRDIEKGFKRIV